MATRKQLKREADAQGIKLSFMPFILKAASLALYRYPDLNRLDCLSMVLQTVYLSDKGTSGTERQSSTELSLRFIELKRLILMPQTLRATHVSVWSE